jgi:hypothetical protein
MQPSSEFIIILGVFVLILLFVSSIADKSTQELWETRIEFLLTKESTTLAEFSEVLGEPKSIERVPCGSQFCTKSFWDVALASNACWKRVVLVIDESTSNVIWSMSEKLIQYSRGVSGPICAASPS